MPRASRRYPNSSQTGSGHAAHRQYVSTQLTLRTVLSIRSGVGRLSLTRWLSPDPLSSASTAPMPLRDGACRGNFSL